VSKAVASKLRPLAVLSVLRELRRGADDSRPIAVAGASELVPVVVRLLREGGETAAVAVGPVTDAAVLVWVGKTDTERLREASRSKVPIVAVTEDQIVPYVLAGSVVRVAPGQEFPVDEIATAIAGALGEQGVALAARLPVLRAAVCEQLIDKCARKNAAIAAAVFVPGVDLPLLTMNQIRLVLRIALAYGEELDQSRAAEIVGVVGAGYGFRMLAREALDFVPVVGWAVKGAVAFGGTRAIGMAAVRLCEARHRPIP
jgi:uncharacterized protein (DUF697 family)